MSAISLWASISSDAAEFLTDLWPVVLLAVGIALAEAVAPLGPNAIRAAGAVFGKLRVRGRARKASAGRVLTAHVFKDGEKIGKADSLAPYGRDRVYPSKRGPYDYTTEWH